VYHFSSFSSARNIGSTVVASLADDFLTLQCSYSFFAPFSSVREQKSDRTEGRVGGDGGLSNLLSFVDGVN